VWKGEAHKDRRQVLDPSFHNPFTMAINGKNFPCLSSKWGKGISFIYYSSRSKQVHAKLKSIKISRHSLTMHFIFSKEAGEKNFCQLSVHDIDIKSRRGRTNDFDFALMHFPGRNTHSLIWVCVIWNHSSFPTIRDLVGILFAYSNKID